jgi:homoserine O-acetyltransferase
MKSARAIALLSYRNYTAYTATQQGWHPKENISEFKPPLSRAETYQRYQGEKLARRFNAFSYYFLSQSMDLHDVGRDRGGSEKALQQIQAKALVVSISSDILFPTSEQEELARFIPDAVFKVIDSSYGHDGFLLEFEKLTGLLRDFLTTIQKTQDNYSSLKLNA